MIQHKFTQKHIDHAWIWFKNNGDMLRLFLEQRQYGDYSPPTVENMSEPEEWSLATWSWFFIRVGMGDFVCDNQLRDKNQ